MDGGAWWAAVHGVAKSRTRLSDFSFTFHFHALEKEMAAHSSFLAWRIPGTGEPGGLPSTGSHRVGHDLNKSSCKKLARGHSFCPLLMSVSEAFSLFLLYFNKILLHRISKWSSLSLAPDQNPLLWRSGILA